MAHMHIHSHESNALTHTHYHTYTWQLLSPHAITTGLTRAHTAHTYTSPEALCQHGASLHSVKPRHQQHQRKSSTALSLCTLHTASAYNAMKEHTHTNYTDEGLTRQGRLPAARQTGLNTLNKCYRESAAAARVKSTILMYCLNQFES